MLPSRDTAAESTRFVRADLLSAALACYPSASASTSPCACAPDAASPSHSHPLDAQSILISLFLNGREQRRKGGRRGSCSCRLPSKPHRRGGAPLLVAKLLPCVLTARPLPAQICAPPPTGKGSSNGASAEQRRLTDRPRRQRRLVARTAACGWLVGGSPARRTSRDPAAEKRHDRGGDRVLHLHPRRI
jgi:hypothetical protein